MGAFESLHHRDYLRLWLGAFVSNAGTWGQSVAVSWYVFELTDSAFWVGAVNFVSFIPLAMAPLGGLVADRMNRRRLLMITQLVMMAEAVLLATLTQLDLAPLPVLLVLTFSVGAAFAFTGPAWQAMVPALVPPESMVNAIALNSAQFSMARVVGPAIAGPVVATVGPVPIFWANAVSFAAVLWALATIRPREQTRGAVGRAMADLRAGIRYAFGHRMIRRALGSLSVLTFFGGPVIALLPLYAARVYGHGAGAYGALYAAMALGSVLGALLLGRRGRAGPNAIAGALVASGLALVATATLRTFAGGLASMFAFGAAYLYGVSGTNSAIQKTVDDAYRGRVLSLFMVTFGGFFPIGSLLAGAVASAVGPALTTAGGAAVCIAWGLWLLIRHPEGADA